MKKWKFSKRIAAFLLAMSMMLNLMPSTALAAKGDLANVDTGLTGDIDTADTISLPIKILDYEADGMLFEFAESYAMKSAYDFGSEYCQVTDTTGDIGISSNVGGFDTTADVTVAAKSNDYVNYVRLTYKSTTSNNWLKGNSGCYISTYNGKDSDDNWIGVLSNLTDMKDVRYVTLVYRSSVSSDNMYFAFGDSAVQANTSGYYTGAYDFTNKGADGEGSSTNWTYVVYDLKTGTLGSNWSNVSGPNYFYIGLPLDSANEWIDLAHVAFFSDIDAATAFGEYALTDGSDRGDNRGFGLLRSSRNQSGGNNYAGIVDETTTVEQLNTYGDDGYVEVGDGEGDYTYDSSTEAYEYVGDGNGTYIENTVDFSTIDTLGYTLLGVFGRLGIANVGLLESSLSAKGYPVYKEEVVTYVANLLKHSLEITERTSDGWKNYRYVKGTASSVYGGTDLATALRTKINGTTGSYATASDKDLVGTWAEVGGKIASYYDAAYFLLNSIFVPGSYNVEQDDYNYLVLSAGTDSETNEKVYVFDGGFATSATPSSAVMAIDYNTTDKTIQNTSAAGKSHFVYEGSSTTTLNPFLPVTDRNTESGMTQNPYYQDDGVINGVKKQTTKDTLYKRNFGFTMVSEGEFVYHADDELFFEFEGDDDVYLFINGELVMDIGSAHSIDKVRFELNDYVNAAKAGKLGISATRNEKLALEEGGTYEFKFYYMERHSYGSNIRVVTNIHVTDPSMTTAKPAWQDGIQLDFGSIVDPDKVVEYGFAITNSGEEKLYNLTFTDNYIGVKLDPINGLTVTGSRVYDVNGGTLEASDLTAVVSHPAYDDITVTFADNEALKAFLASLASDAVVENGGGLWEKSTVLIRGIGYKLSADQVAAGVFDNTVLTTSTNQTKSKTLQGQATMRVFVPADPMYYEWAGHDLSVTMTKLVTDILAAANQEDNILNGKVSNLTTSNVNKIELVTKAGTAISSSYVTIDGDNNITINYPTAGSKVFYVKITYNSSKNTVIVPVLVNVTDVENSIYVLDYGLSVDLTANNELFKNDVLTVPGRTTINSILGIGSNGAYSSNEIAFTTDEDGTVNSTYGDFTLNEGKITYAPDTFMNNMDTVQLAVNVYESGSTPSNITGTLDINNEVEMYKNISVLPANVVYYEDCFPAITYSDSETNTQNANTFAKLGSQSNDQNQEYGQDDYYQDDTTMSAGSLTTITIADSDVTASFTFTGTGFELIGRTNASDSATLTVSVYDAEAYADYLKDKSKGEPSAIKVIPVINEFDNGNNGGNEEIYQVPVIRVKDMPKDTYTVKISGVPAYDWDNWDGSLDENYKPVNIDIIPTILYVDGLRIFQPMGETNDNYNEAENGAAFVEIRNKIAEGVIAVAKYDGYTTTTFSGNASWVENLNGIIRVDETTKTDTTYTGNLVESIDEYLMYGPNNEVYLNGSLEDAALIFYVIEDGSGVHNLQVAVRAIDEAAYYIGTDYSINTGEVMKATLQYGAVDGTGNLVWTAVDTVESGTEQYYTIDYTKCPEVKDSEGNSLSSKKYQVAIRVETGMASFTSLKLNGLNLDETDAIGENTTLYYDNGILKDAADNQPATENYMSFRMVSSQMSSDTVMSEEELEDTFNTSDSIVETPEVQEPAEDADNIPNQNDYTSRVEFIKKLIEFLKKFWGR